MFTTNESNLRSFAKLDECMSGQEVGKRSNSAKGHRSNQWLDSYYPSILDFLFTESDGFLKLCKSLSVWDDSASDRMNKILPALPSYLCTESAADIMQSRFSTRGDDAIPDLAHLFPRILWKRLLFSSGLYFLQVICNLASPLVTFSLLRWAEDEGWNYFLDFLYKELS